MDTFADIGLLEKNLEYRANARLAIATQLLTGMCANPNIWAAEATKQGVAAENGVCTCLSAIALEQADNLIGVAISAHKASAAMAASAANEGTMIS